MGGGKPLRERGVDEGDITLGKGGGGGSRDNTRKGQGWEGTKHTGLGCESSGES